MALLVLFFVLDLLLALRLFTPQLFTQRSFHSISAISETGDNPIHITNEKELRKKLDQLDFWGVKKVNRYKLIIDKVTVEHLVFVITNKAQHFGQRIDNGSLQYSFGQTYDSNTKTLEIYLQMHPNFQNDKPLDKRLSSLAMFALYDHTFTYPKKDEAKYNLSLKEFVTNAPVIFRFGII